MRNIGKNIKHLRLQQKLTQDELAERLFVTRQTVSNYETGKSKPDVEMLAKIAEILGTDVQQLIYGPESNPDKYKKRALLFGTLLTLFWGIIYLLIYPAAKQQRYDYFISLNMMNRALILPLMLMPLGWTLAQLAGMAFRFIPPNNNWTVLCRKILLLLLCVALTLSFWYFAVLVTNDLLYQNHIRGKWTDTTVTNTVDNTTYITQGWEPLPPPIPDWLGWFGFYGMTLTAGKHIWFYPLLGAVLWLLDFPKKKGQKEAS